MAVQIGEELNAKHAKTVDWLQLSVTKYLLL